MTRLSIFPDITYTCDQYCDKKYVGRPNAENHEDGAWFCRGLWKHNDKYHGGCHYWRGPGDLSLDECKKECKTSGLLGQRVFLKNGGHRVTEVQSCKDGCGIGGMEKVLEMTLYRK